METLRAVNDDTPHPTGTEANAAMRVRIEEQFQKLGYEVTVQSRFVCSPSASCAEVHNVIARRPKASAGKSVLLVAHYDSVPAGPGASDDSIGVAALLEIARAVRNERFRNDVVFLVDDGEEVGLLGAEAFVADPALREQVGVVLNVEARGTYGPSTMFETSRGNRWLIRHLAQALDTPQTSSIYSTVYDLLPNDTDVTVFKRSGLAAVNFGSIRGVQWYHTPFDDVAHVSLRTLQHHGDNLLSSLRVFAEADLDARSDRNATWFDLLGFTLIWWPQEWTVWLAAGSLLLLLIGARRSDPRAMTFGVLATFTTLVLTLPVALAVSRLARARSLDINFVADPRASIIAMWLTGLACATAAFALFDRRKDAKAMLFGAAIAWHAIAIALALTLPGAAFLFFVPAAAVSICAVLRLNETASIATGATVAAALTFPFGVVLYEALGGRLMAAVAVVIGIFATFLAPLFPRWKAAAAAAAGAIAFAAVAMIQPAYTAAAPKHNPLAWIDDPANGAPRWTARTATPEMEKLSDFVQREDAALPWRPREWSAPAPKLPVARVALDGERTASGALVRVTSQRAADRIVLLVRGGTIRSVNGVVPPPRAERHRSRLPAGWSMAAITGGAELRVEIDAKGPLELIASDTSFALPEEGTALAAARNSGPGTPVQDGDVTVTRARLTL